MIIFLCYNQCEGVFYSLYEKVLYKQDYFNGQIKYSVKMIIYLDYNILLSERVLIW